jgi:hypothetical protein
MLLDGFIANEQNTKLRRIAEVVRDAGRDQIQRVMEVLLAPETASLAARTDDPEPASENSRRKQPARAH